jgi:hypothetical protein
MFTAAATLLSSRLRLGLTFGVNGSADGEETEEEEEEEEEEGIKNKKMMVVVVVMMMMMKVELDLCRFVLKHFKRLDLVVLLLLK